MHSHASVIRRQQVFGYTEEELRLIIAPMANTGTEPIGSMGTDSPIAVLSSRPRLIFDYFKQLFAQVTNPPLDAIREELVTSLTTKIGPERNLLEPTAEAARQITMNRPILDSEQLAKIVRLNQDGELPGYGTHVVRGLYKVAGGGRALEKKIDEICQEVSAAIRGGARAIVLSDRHSTAELAPIPSLLLTAAVHHHLVREKTRTQVGLVVEAGDVREVHHMALLIGFGAAAINPYLVFESAEDLARREMYVDVSAEKAIANVAKALSKGVLKVMSKMGVSTIASYTGAQIFECVGLSQEVVDRYFTGTTSRLGGLGLGQLADEIKARHTMAYPSDGIPLAHRNLLTGGEYQWRREGEPHLFDPETVFRLQHATSTGDYAMFQRYTSLVNDNSSRIMTLRSLMDFKPGEPISIDEVEPVESIVKRFSTGAMSYGSISMEAHQTLAVAMNRIGGKSNTGEGGEDSGAAPRPGPPLRDQAGGLRPLRRHLGVPHLRRRHPDQDGPRRQARRGRPAARPEGLPVGGQDPPLDARRRADLAAAAPRHLLHRGPQAADPRPQVRQPLGAGAREAGLRDRRRHGRGGRQQGQGRRGADLRPRRRHRRGAADLAQARRRAVGARPGRDPADAAAQRPARPDRRPVRRPAQDRPRRGRRSAARRRGVRFRHRAPRGGRLHHDARVSQGHLPGGRGHAEPELRGKFHGDPDHVVNFFMFMAREVREILASLGLRSIDEAVGRVDLLDVAKAVGHWKTHGLNLSPILAQIDVPADMPRHCTTKQDHGLDTKLDVELIRLAEPALARGEQVRHSLSVRNVDRTVGTMLGHEVTKATDGLGLAPGTIEFTLTGTGGQSFGAFLPRGVTLRLIGDSNDYFGKGLSGGRLVVAPPPDVRFDPAEQIVAGNVIGYGATSGQMFLRGLVGERFCVRNSGATAVVEGVGDHGCEYMTGGEVLVLGSTGRNFAAGMSGGVAWVLDLNPLRLNTELADPVDPEPEDVARIRELMDEHRAETGSLVADELLQLSDEDLRLRFTKVQPRDFARIMAVQARSVADGLSEEETTKLMMEAAHG